MSRKSKAEHLAEVKLALAKKYENLARTAKSKPLREKRYRKAEGYRQQAAAASRLA